MRKIYASFALILFLILNGCGINRSNSIELSPTAFATSSDDIGSSVTANSSGVFVSCYTNGALEGTPLGAMDACVRRYNSITKVWGRQFGSSVQDVAIGISINGTESYVLGQTTGSIVTNLGGHDSFLRKYNGSGSVVWTRQFGSNLDDSAIFITTDSSGRPHTLTSEENLGRFVIRRYSTSGTVQRTIIITDSNVLNGMGARALTVDGSGNIFFLARSFNTASNTYDTILYKFSSTGVIASGFPKSVYASTNDDEPSYDLRVDASGNLYFLVRDSGSTKGAYLVKINGSGTTLWSARLEPLALGGSTNPKALSLDSSGNVYITGTTNNAFPGFTMAGSSDFFAMKFNSTGTLVWTQQLGATGPDIANDIAVSDAVYIVGNSQSNPNLLGQPAPGGVDAFLVRLNLTNGAVLGIDQ